MHKHEFIKGQRSNILICSCGKFQHPPGTVGIEGIEKGQHTPGPWKIDRACGDIISIGPLGTKYTALDDQGLEIWLDIPEADARLIAAAPELLEAAKFAYSIIAIENNLGMGKRTDYLSAEAYLKLEAAIAKAEGQ